MSSTAASSRPSDRFAVCVFAASAESVAPAYRVLARELGGAIAAAGWELVYGGGRVGLMGEMAVGALQAGGHVTGIIPHQLNSAERAFTDVTDLVLVDSLGERKLQMVQRSDAFAVLPGGIGTLDEITDVLTTRHLGLHAAPLVLVDPDDFWAPFGALLDHMVAADVMPAATARLVVRATTVPDAIAALRDS